MFAWLKHRVKQAILDGVSEAAEEIESADADTRHAALPQALADRLALPAPEKVNGKGKAK